MGVSKNKVTPKWMVKIMENPTKMDDLGGTPTIFGNIHILYLHICYLCFFPAGSAHSVINERTSHVLKTNPVRVAKQNPHGQHLEGPGNFTVVWAFLEVRCMAKIPWEKSHGKIWGETKKKRNTRMFLEGHRIFQWIEVIP